MNDNIYDGLEINLDLINRLMRNWPKRASVRGCYFDEFKTNDGYNPAIPDYPIELVPFWNHPSFEKTDEEIKFKILTWGWLVYNLRTIHAEEKIVNPSFDLIIADTFQGTTDSDLKNVVHQSLIDERFHSLMHFNAMNVTRELRSINKNIVLPDSITYRILKSQQEKLPEKWKKQLMILISGIVSETSINAYLSLLSKCKSVQEKHALVSRLHDVDEFAHSSILVEVAKSVFSKLSNREKKFFIEYLPDAMNAFCAQDYTTWESILRHFNIPNFKKIIADCENQSDKAKMINDYSGLKRIADELNINRDLNYDFN